MTTHHDHQMDEQPSEPMATDHSGHEDHTMPAGGDNNPGHESHAGHDKHAGHSPEMFRDRFWLSLAMTLPVVFFSEMIQDWFGYAPSFPGSDWLSPVLGTLIFIYGGSPFLKGAVQEARDRAPGMMLLIGMAITVAFVASAATTLGWFDLEFWWELAALITIMLLGHVWRCGRSARRGEPWRHWPSCCPTRQNGSSRGGPKWSRSVT
jgi:Cu2+-exporting ATPase